MKLNRHSLTAFTLIELLASMTILGLIMAMLFAAFEQINKAWLQGESRVEIFTQARAALDLMSRELSQALASDRISFYAKEETISLGNVAPVNLHLGNVAFVACTGDMTSDGMDLVEVVYRLSTVNPPGPGGVAEGAGAGAAPYFFTDTAPGPYRLMRRASGFLGIPANCRNYGNFTPGGAAPWDFYGTPTPNAIWPETSDRTRTAVLAENVISLQFQFQDSTTPTPVTYDHWNSTANTAWQNELSNPPLLDAGVANMQNRTPTLVIIRFTVLDSKTALRYRAANDPDVKKRIYQQSGYEFTTTIAIPNRQP
jgi:type II secretory pathway pseudopilin PulG